MKRVRLEYYAYFRDKAGVECEDVSTGAETLAELYCETAERHGFALPLKSVKAVVGEEFAPMSTPVAEGAVVAFVPPVAGG
jgi:molybdopterin synthase sulfur carrier subunit